MAKRKKGCPPVEVVADPSWLDTIVGSGESGQYVSRGSFRSYLPLRTRAWLWLRGR